MANRAKKRCIKLMCIIKFFIILKTFQLVVVSITRYVTKIVRNRAIFGYYKEGKTTLTTQL